MSLKRILKLLAAFFTGQGVSIVTQLLVPPFFLHRYAPRGGGLRRVDCADSGSELPQHPELRAPDVLPTTRWRFITTEERWRQAKTIQASAVKLSLALIVVVALAGSTVLMMPVGRWLHLRYVGSFAASLTVFVLILQLVITWLFSLLAQQLHGAGAAHRGIRTGAMPQTAALPSWRCRPFCGCVRLFPCSLSRNWRRSSSLRCWWWPDIRVTVPILLPSLALWKCEDDARDYLAERLLWSLLRFRLSSVAGSGSDPPAEFLGPPVSRSLPSRG